MPTGIYLRSRPIKGGFKKGITPWNTGKKMPPSSDETRKKMSDAHKGRKPYVMTDEIRKNMSKAKLGTKQPFAVRVKQSNALAGRIPKNTLMVGRFGNVKRGWFDIAGKRLFFRSKWEANYALYLNFLVKQKQIKDWNYEKDVFIFHKI